ncbi:hypothetical protein JTB14_026231 [Gonioctena quinquepunctata]|nr:hypothetical protein JTB14_026231 [Gonioctena quinquepunctata]
MTAVVEGVTIEHGKRKRWSPEQIQVKTAAWGENQKKKSNKGTCECGGTDRKHIFLIGKEDYRIKRMCRGSIAETTAVCGIELVSKMDSNCIRQALQENEQFESEYAKNMKPSLSGKNAEEVMEEAYGREVEIGKTLREKEEKQKKNREKDRETSDREVNQLNVGKGKTPPKPKPLVQNKAEPGPSTAEETHLKNVIKKAMKSVQEEESDFENNIVIKRIENKGKYRGKSTKTKGYLKAQDEINDFDEDISNAARIWTEKSVQEMKASHHKICSIPFSVLEQSYRNSTYDYWLDKMTRKYQGDRKILRNQVKDT